MTEKYSCCRLVNNRSKREVIDILNDQSNPGIPFAITFGICFLILSLILVVVNTAINWEALIGLMPDAIPAQSRTLLLISNTILILSIALWLIFKVACGFNWARILLFLGYIIMVPLAIPSLIEMFYYSKISVTMSAATLLIQFFSLTLLFSDSANEWFKEQKMERM